MILDIRTIGIFSAMTPFLLGLIMLIYWRERKVYAGFGYWVLANFGLSGGYLFVALRGVLPDFLSIILGNVLVVYSILLMYEGIEHFYGRSAFSRLNYAILGGFFLAQCYFTYLDPNINVHLVIACLVLCVLIIRTALRLFKSTIPELARTARSAGYLFLGTALFPLARGLNALFQSEPIDFFADPINSWFSIIFIISIIAWSFYFFFLNSARLEVDLEAALAELELAAGTDALTSLYNRRRFNEYAEIEFQRAQRYGSSLSIMMLDADDLKLVNDTYGHDAGDRVLLSISDILRAEVRPFDLVARYGGDEFVILLVDTKKEEAHSIAERIRREAEQTFVRVNSDMLNVHLSVGIADVGLDDIDLAMTLKRTDIALYHAKQQGRNRVMIA